MPKTRKTKSIKRWLKQKDRGIVDFIQIVLHFFKDMPQWINDMSDPRHQSYVKYIQSDLVFMGILKNVCGVESMCQMNENFNEETCIDTLSFISGNKNLNEMPDKDTLNYYLSKLSPEQLKDLRQKMINRLIRSKLFNRFRLFNKYWLLVMDGTGLHHFNERHCEHCLSTKTKYIDKEGNECYRHSYYHKVFEVKILLGNGLVLSLGTEFIENEKENVPKQDCETNAAKRLLKRIKEEYKRLPICILGDSLFATEPMMEMCACYGWKYIFNLKEGSQKSIYADYQYLKGIGEMTVKKNILDEKGVGTYVNHVEELTGKKEIFNIFEYRFTYYNKGEMAEKCLVWVSNIELNLRNIEDMILAGRSRWKIENEGFNSQKNGILKIEHLNSHDSNAMKNHYLLAQISDILLQLYLNCNKIIEMVGQSIKNTSSRLLESFRGRPITDEDVSFINKYTTIRLLE